jgi:Acyl-CoA dehydrogenase, N-terminal domain
VRFAFTRDQLLFRDSVRDVLRRECTPAVVRASWEKREAGDVLWKTLAELGVVGLTAPEEHGGLGLGALDWVLLFEECGRFAAPVPLVETMAALVPLVSEVGSEDFKREWLPRIGKGEARVALGLASPRDASPCDPSPRAPSPRAPSPPSPLSHEGRGGDCGPRDPSPFMGEARGGSVERIAFGHFAHCGVALSRLGSSTLHGSMARARAATST